MNEPVRIIIGDVRDELRKLLDGSVHCCVTSPPYWGLRDYQVAGQIGLEATPDAFVAEMVGVFREVRRVLREEAERWIQANPEVFRMYESIALEYAKTGCAFGIDLVTCILRWERRFDWSETFKINSNYRAYIARALMQKHPELGNLMKIPKTRY